MWSGLFQMLAAGFNLVTALVTKKKDPPPQQDVDAQAARQGTASGAAAYEASKIAGRHPRNNPR